MRTTPIPNPLPGPSPRIRSWRVSRASHNAPRPPKPHNLSHEPLLQDTREVESLSKVMILTVRRHINGKAPNMTRMGKWFESGSGARPRGRGGTKLQVSQRCQAMLDLSARTHRADSRRGE